MSEQGAIAYLAYDWTIVTYFFLGGLSAGTYLFSVVANYWKQEYKHLAIKSAVLSLVTLGLGLLMLLAHLGRPERAWLVFTSFNPHSMLSWGSWLLNGFGLICLIYVTLLLRGRENQAKFVAYLGLPFAIFTATYTGIHINQAPDRIIWHTALVPVLFFNGAVICGLASAMLLSVTQKNAETPSKLGKYLACLILVELGMIMGEVLLLLKGGTHSVAAAQILFSGQIGCLFLGFEITLGAVVPVVLLLWGKTNALSRVLIPALVLIGIFAMRYVIVIGGQLAS